MNSLTNKDLQQIVDLHESGEKDKLKKLLDELGGRRFLISRLSRITSSFPSKYQKQSANAPGSSNAQEKAFVSESPREMYTPPDPKLRRVMRRNEALELLHSCKSPRFYEVEQFTTSDEFFEIPDVEVEKIFREAFLEFKSLMGREALISSRPLCDIEEDKA